MRWVFGASGKPHAVVVPIFIFCLLESKMEMWVAARHVSKIYQKCNLKIMISGMIFRYVYRKSKRAFKKKYGKLYCSHRN